MTSDSLPFTYEHPDLFHSNPFFRARAALSEASRDGQTILATDPNDCVRVVLAFHPLLYHSVKALLLEDPCEKVKWALDKRPFILLDDFTLITVRKGKPFVERADTIFRVVHNVAIVVV